MDIMFRRFGIEFIELKLQIRRMDVKRGEMDLNRNQNYYKKTKELYSCVEYQLSILSSLLIKLQISLHELLENINCYC